MAYFTARSNFVTEPFLLKKIKTVDFSEPIAACDLKVGRCRQLIKFMKVYEYSRSRSFLTLAQNHLHMKIKTCISQKPLCQLNHILQVSFRVRENENLLS